MSASKRNGPRRGQPQRHADRGPVRRPVKVTPRRKREIDPQLVALVYYLIASRLVRDTQTQEEAESPAAGPPEPSSPPEAA